MEEADAVMTIPPSSAASSSRPAQGTLRRCISNTQPYLGDTQPLGSPMSQVAPIAILRSLTVGKVPHVEILPDTEDVTFGRLTDENSTNRHVWVTADDKRVSATHCQIWRVDDGGDGVPRFYVKDTSSNGTFLNGVRMEKGKQYPMRSGDEVSLIVDSQKQKHLGTRSRLICAFVLRVLGVERSSVLQDAGSKVELKYNVLSKVLGSGAFSQVLLCTSLKTSEQLALKVVDKKKFMQFRMRRNTQLTVDDERKVMETIVHPNVVRLHETFDTPNSIYLVLEFLAGGDLLQRILDHGIYRPPVTRRLFQDILSGIRCLHDNGIAHRDIKPENILLTSAGDDGVAKLADMGLAKHVEDYATAQAQRATVCGTPHYFAPETVRLAKEANSSVACGKAVDMWAAGVVLYIMLVGFPPFEEEGLYEQIAAGSYSVEGDQWQDVSVVAKDLVQRLMDVNSEKRLTAVEAIEHPWLEAEMPLKRTKTDVVVIDSTIERTTLVGERKPASPQITV